MVKKEEVPAATMGRALHARMVDVYLFSLAFSLELLFVHLLLHAITFFGGFLTLEKGEENSPLLGQLSDLS